MLKQNLITLVLGMVGVLFAGAVSAEIYTWKDANGRVQFSDQPPPNVDAKPTRSVSKSSGSTEPEAKPDPRAPAGPKTLAEKDLEFRQRKAEQAEKAGKAKEEESKKAEKDRYCEDVKRNLASLESGARIGRTNTKGETEMLDDDARKSEGDDLRGRIAKDCK